MRSRFKVHREQFSLQAHFASPVFDLFKDMPELVRHLFNSLGSYGIRLTDLRFDSPGESLGEVNLRILSLSDLDTARLFLDRLEMSLNYTPFLGLRDGNLVPDLLAAVASYPASNSFRAFSVTQEVHGVLDLPPQEFLSQFASAAPKRLGTLLGSGTVFYYGASEGILAGSIALDLSRLIDSGIFLKLTTMYDAAQIDPIDLLAVSRGDFSGIMEEIGLDFGKD